MASRFDRKFWISAVAVLAAAGFCVHLGLWQLERLAWKNDLIAKIEAQKTIDATKVNLTPLIENPENNLMRGTLTGVWVLDKTMRVGPRMLDSQLGEWMVTPFLLNDGTQILVNRGWVADKMAPLAADTLPPKGIVTITGTLRIVDSGTSEPVGGNARTWHDIDTKAMTRAMALENLARLAVFMEKSNPVETVAFTPAPVSAELRNEHKNYAIFWFVMAGVMIVMFGVVNLRGKR